MRSVTSSPRSTARTRRWRTTATSRSSGGCSAVDLWRRMLTMLFETGHPWITFKDPCNLRSPQQHSGVVHSSNLCTEITLNTNIDEVAVCNLGSVNLAQHVTADGIDHARLAKTVRTAVRMLDNVIDVNYYTIPEARNSNMRHRPVGMGLMGFQDALFTLGTPMASKEAVEFADRRMEEISYYAIEALGRTGAGARRVRVVRRFAVVTRRPAVRLDRAPGARRAPRASSTSTVRPLWTGASSARRSGAVCGTRTSWPSRRPRPSRTSPA